MASERVHVNFLSREAARVAARQQMRPPGTHGRPRLRARGSFQCLVGNRVGEDFFVSLVEVGINLLSVHVGSFQSLPRAEY
jgi:hypothetical protein